MTVTVEAPVDALDRGSTALPDPLTGSAEPVGRAPTPLRRWTGTDPVVGWYLTILITAIAAFTRYWRLDYTKGYQFDEAYYAVEAQEMLRYGYEHNLGYLFIVHPSVGKWAIAIGSAIFGNNELGWRVMPATAGTLSVLLTVRIARRMLRSNLFGALAGLLLAMDGVSLVTSRLALLDIFLQFFTIAAFGALVLDRDQFRARLAGFIELGGQARDGVPALGPRPWRLAGAVLLGLDCGVKWSALSFLVLFAMMSLVWDVGALRSAGVRRPVGQAFRHCWITGSATLGLGALGAYLFTWLGWLVGENSSERYYSTYYRSAGIAEHFPGWIRDLLFYHSKAYDFHVGLDSPHVSKATAWSWLILARPTFITYNQTPAGQDGHATCGAAKCVDETLLIGTPIMWWCFVPMLLWLTWHWATTRDWRAASVLVAFVAGWAVWLQHPKRTSFLFYMDPLMPFLAIGLAFGIGTMVGPARAVPIRLALGIRGRRPEWRVIGASLLLGTIVADFVWMFPIFTDMTLTLRGWQERMWFNSWI